MATFAEFYNDVYDETRIRYGKKVPSDEQLCRVAIERLYARVTALEVAGARPPDALGDREFIAELRAECERALAEVAAGRTATFTINGVAVAVFYPSSGVAELLEWLLHREEPRS